MASKQPTAKKESRSPSPSFNRAREIIGEDDFAAFINSTPVSVLTAVQGVGDHIDGKGLVKFHEKLKDFFNKEKVSFGYVNLTKKENAKIGRVLYNENGIREPPSTSIFLNGVIHSGKLGQWGTESEFFIAVGSAYSAYASKK